MNNPTKSTGTVRFFDDKKGYGFIGSQTGQDVFLHHSDIMMDGYRRATTGDGAKYTEVKTETGLKATAVEIYESNWPYEQDYAIRKTTAKVQSAINTKSDKVG